MSNEGGWISFEHAGADDFIQKMIPLTDCTIPTWGECSQVRTAIVS
jgi:hypothetical protein